MEPASRTSKPFAMGARQKSRLHRSGRQSTRRIPSHIILGAFLEQKGWFHWLELSMSILSLFTVMSYIVDTYEVADFRQSDFAIGIVFSIDWLFRLYISPSRLLFVFSWNSFVDVITFMPMLILTHFELRSLATVMFRLLRIMRIFRILSIMRVGRRNHSEVKKRVMLLGITLLCLMLIAAGAFFEFERQWGSFEQDFGYPLKFHDCIYWAAVTISTVGYGDIHPTVWASQMLFVLLMLAFLTVLPYQTGALVEALAHSSRFQRDRYKRKPRQGHVIVTGGFDHVSLGIFLQELFHEDHGFRQTNAVVLSPQPPDGRVRDLLNETINVRRSKYIQGSPMDGQDLQRCQARYADAIFILCDKQASSPQEEDTRNIMTLLAIGQALQQVYGQGIVTAKLMKPVRSCWHKLAGVELTGPPKMYIQLLMPQSVQRLKEIMLALQQRPSHKVPPSPQEASSAAKADSGTSERYTQDDVQHYGSMRHSPSRTGLKPSISQGFKTVSTPSLRLVASDMDSAEFWKRFEASISTTCISEMKETLLGLSCLGTRGLLPLLANLARSFDQELLELHGFEEQLPAWLREYVSGLDSEVYELRYFPPHLVGLPFGLVTQHLYDTRRLVLLGLGYKTWRSSQRQYRMMPLEMLIEEDMIAYLIASDISDVAELEEMEEQVYSEWLDSKPEEERYGHTDVEQGSPMPHSQAQQQQQHPQQPGANGLARSSSPLDGLRGMLHHSSTSGGKHHGHHSKASRSALQGPHSSSAFVRNASLVETMADEVEAALRKMDAAAGAGGETPCSPGSCPAQMQHTHEHHNSNHPENQQQQQQHSGQPRAPRHSSGRRQQQQQHMERLYHVVPHHQHARGHMMEIEECTIKGHVLVLGGGGSPDCLMAALAPFRSKLLSSWAPIVILDQMSPTGAGWDELAQFPDIFFVSGSPLSGRDLARASAGAAARAMIFPHFGASKQRASDGDSDMFGDADVIFIVQKLRSVNPDVEIYTELVNPASMAFLNPIMPFTGFGDVSPLLMPPFTSGQVFLASLADSLTCQSFYNRSSGKMMRDLLAAWHTSSSSAAFSRSRGHIGAGDGDAPQVAMVNIPVDVGSCATFGALFSQLLARRHMLCLALYRQAHSEGRQFHYVVTRPAADLALRPSDEAMVVVDLGAYGGRLPDDVCGYNQLATGQGDEDDGDTGSPGAAAAAAQVAATAAEVAGGRQEMQQGGLATRLSFGSMVSAAMAAGEDRPAGGAGPAGPWSSGMQQEEQQAGGEDLVVLPAAAGAAAGAGALSASGAVQVVETLHGNITRKVDAAIERQQQQHQSPYSSAGGRSNPGSPLAAGRSLGRPTLQNVIRRVTTSDLEITAAGGSRAALSRWVRASSSSGLAMPPAVQQLQGSSEREALQEVYASVQQLGHTLQGEVQRLHLEVRALKDRVNGMQGGMHRRSGNY